MAKVLIGNFKGPQGGQGIPGPQGEQRDQGIRGSRWTEGTAITGTSTTPTVFSGTGIADALAEDLYLNTDTGNVYRCTTAGAANVAKWVYACNLKGIKGDTGAKGETGTAGPKGEKGDTGEQGPKGDTPTVADNMTVAFTQAATRENIATGEKMSVLMGKIKKFFADLTAPAFAQMITTKEDLLATKVTGYVPDAKAVADTYTELNGKLLKYDKDKISVNKPNIAIGTNIIDGTAFTLSKGIYFITVKVQGISAITRNDQRIEFWVGNAKSRLISQVVLPHNTPYPIVTFASFANVIDEDTFNVYSYVDITTLSLFSVDIEIVKLLG